MDSAVHIGSVESGDHGVLQGEQGSAHGPCGHGAVQLAVFIETYAPGGIDEGETQIQGHDFCRQVFTPAGGIIPLGVCY